MYAINILSSLNKSLSTNIRRAVLSLEHFRRFSYKPKHPTSYSLKPQVEKDLVLFRLESPKFFLCVNIFSLAQCAFWTYLGVFISQSLKNSSFTLKGQKFWGEVLEKEKRYADTLGVICVILGWTIFAATAVYSFRSVRKIILHKGGSKITLVTYGLPGYNSVKIPLANISSLQHRTKAKKFIPVKVKDNYFYYLIDVSGEFTDPQLFDFTAGIKRGF